MEWSKEARRLIAEVHAGLPGDATLALRKKAIRDAFPDSWRGASWPYKAWLKARKDYLKSYDATAPAPLLADPHSPCAICGEEHPVGVLDADLCPACVDEEDCHNA